MLHRMVTVEQRSACSRMSLATAVNCSPIPPAISDIQGRTRHSYECSSCHKMTSQTSKCLRCLSWPVLGSSTHLGTRHYGTLNPRSNWTLPHIFSSWIYFHYCSRGNNQCQKFGKKWGEEEAIHLIKKAGRPPRPICAGFSVGRGQQGRPTFLKKCRPDRLGPRLGSASIPTVFRGLSAPPFWNFADTVLML
jgi:hypothetical protein